MRGGGGVRNRLNKVGFIKMRLALDFLHSVLIEDFLQYFGTNVYWILYFHLLTKINYLDNIICILLPTIIKHRMVNTRYNWKSHVIGKRGLKAVRSLWKFYCRGQT